MNVTDYLTILRRRWVLAVSCFLFAITAGGVVLLQMTPQYSSTVRLYASAPQTDAAEAYQGGLLSEQRAASYAELASSPELARKVVDRLDLRETPVELSQKVDATITPETVILGISVTDPEPARAERIVVVLSEEFSSFVQRLEATPHKERPLVMVSPLGEPQTPKTPESPRTVRVMGVAALLGLMVGVGAGVLRENLDVSVRDAGELADLTDKPLLGSMPNDPSADKRRTITTLEPYAPRAEAFRVLRTNLQFVNIDQSSKVIVVTSAVPGEGKTTIACNLALSLAQTGRRVALVDGDLRRPGVAGYLGLEHSVGLTSVLIGQVDLANALQQQEAGGVSVLTGGIVPPNPAELLQSRALADVLIDLRQMFDVVIVDTPPLLPIADGALLAAQSDGALLIVRYGKTSRQQVRGSMERLASVRAHVIGTLLNRMPASASGYSYGYGYAPRQPTAPTGVEVQPGLGNLLTTPATRGRNRRARHVTS